MFPLGTRKSFPKDKVRNGESSVSAESDLIELVSRPQIPQEGPSGHGPGDDRMVIRKEVRYSIQYEDEDQARREERAHEVSVYV
jgi:hypothetical protein